MPSNPAPVAWLVSLINNPSSRPDAGAPQVLFKALISTLYDKEKSVRRQAIKAISEVLAVGIYLFNTQNEAPGTFDRGAELLNK